MSTLRDPIADLAKEIAAEEAASQEAEDDAGEVKKDPPARTAAPKPAKRAAAKADDETADDEAEEEDADEDEAEEESEEDKAAAKAKAKEKVAEADDKAKKPKGRYVPVARVNEEAAKRRVSERKVAELETRLSEALAAAKDGKTPLSDEDRNKIVEAVRNQERVRVRSENMVSVGQEEYGEKEFDSACGVLADLGAPDNMLLLTLEACGSSAAAARALFAMAQDDAAKIEKIFDMNPLRMAAQIAQYAEKSRKKKAAPVKEEPEDEEVQEDDEEVEEAPPVRRAAKKVSQAPDPARPVKGSRKANEDEITDDLSEDEFTDRFDRMMGKSTSRRYA